MLGSQKKKHNIPSNTDNTRKWTKRIRKMSNESPEAVSTSPVTENDKNKSPAKTKKKKKGKIPGINKVLHHKSGVREYIYGFPIHSMAIGKSKYPKLSESRLVVFVGGGGSTKSGIQNSIQINGCEVDAEGTLSMKQLVNHDCGPDLISNVTMSSDAQLLACSIKGECRLYKFCKGEQVSIRQIHQWESDFHTSYPCINVLSFNSGGTKLAIGGDDNVLKVYSLNLIDNKKFAISKAVKLEGHKRAVLDAKFSPVGDLLASSSRDGKCIIWKRDSEKDNGSGEDLYSICATLNASQIKQKFGESMKDARKRGQPFFNCLQWSQTRNCTYLYGVECTKRGESVLVQWRVNVKQVAFTELSRTTLTKDPICAMSVTGDGRMIVVGDSKGYVQLLSVDLHTGEVNVIGTTGNNVHSLAITGVGFVKLNNRKFVPIACSPDSTSTVLPFDEKFRSVFQSNSNMWIFIAILVFLIITAIVIIGVLNFPDHPVVLEIKSMSKEFGLEL